MDTSKIMETLKKYWWVVAGIVLFMFMGKKRGKIKGYITTRAARIKARKAARRAAKSARMRSGGRRSRMRY
jgi:hypothetical protein